MDLIDILKDKQAVLSFLVQTMETNQKAAAGLRSLTNGPNSHSTELYKITKLIDVVSNQAIQLEKMAAILLVYTSSSSFDSDIVKKINEMGRGHEALQQMFKNKMDGK